MKYGGTKLRVKKRRRSKGEGKLKSGGILNRKTLDSAGFGSARNPGGKFVTRLGNTRGSLLTSVGRLGRGVQLVSSATRPSSVSRI